MSEPADTLERFVDHLTRGFTPELAKHFAELPKPDPEFQARLDELAAKANEGSLTAGESQEYDAFVSAGNFIAILQSKARRLLKDHPRTSTKGRVPWQRPIESK